MSILFLIVHNYFKKRDVSNNNENYTKVKSNGNIFSSDNNLSIFLSSKGTPVDDTHILKYNMLSDAKELTKKSSEEPVIASAPAPAPAKVSRLDDIINNKNNVSSPVCGWDSIKGRGWGWTGDGKQGKPPTRTNITFITDPELCKKWYGDYEDTWINFSKPPWNNNNKTNTEHIYSVKEEQSRNIIHSHSIVFKHDTETFDSGNPYDPYTSSSECSSKCSYNHNSKNK